MSTLIPNTFQCFNLYIDRAMEHLTDSEVRVLWYATRHILGWQDKIKKQHGHISISMFEKGYTTVAGKRYAGCGVGRAAIITACSDLVKFKFLNRIGDANEDGQEWEITTDDIQWDALEARTLEKQGKRKAQTKVASIALKAKLSGSSNDTTPAGSFNDTMQGSSNDTMQGSSNDTESKPSSKPSSNPLPRKREPFYDAIAETFELTASGQIVSIRAMMQGNAKKGTWKDCNFEPPVTDPNEITLFGAYMAKRMRGMNITEPISAAVTIQRWFYDYRAVSNKPATAPLETITPDNHPEFFEDNATKRMRENLAAIEAEEAARKTA